jgi:hypothetical protein
MVSKRRKRRSLAQLSATCSAKGRFLEELAQRSNITAAAAAAKVSTTTVYRWRDSDPKFAADWALALAAGYEALEFAMLERARFGTEKGIYHGGTKIDSIRDYGDSQGLRLLIAHRELVAMTRVAMAQGGSRAEIEAELNRKLDQMRSRMLERKSGALLTDDPEDRGLTDNDGTTSASSPGDR